MQELQKKLIEYTLEWNEKINVTAIKDPEEFLKKNILDSIELIRLSEYQESKEILDIGTGGGFPGLPLAIENPEKHFVLNDTIGKKLKVVEDNARRLGLTNVNILHKRAEEIDKEKKFDLVVSRAVANLSSLSELCLPFVKTGGYFIAYKTEDAMEEIYMAKNAIRILGGSIEKIVPYEDKASGHLFVLVKKIKDTPKQYPRKAPLPLKDPLK